MTTEEFHGHLMAALHGPNADEIAAKVFDKILETRGADLGEFVGRLLAKQDKIIVSAAILAWILSAPPDGAAEAMRRASIKRTMREQIATGLHGLAPDNELFAILGMDKPT